MSEVKVNKISPRSACGTVTLGDSGDTFTIPSGVSITNQGTASGFGSTGEVSWVTTTKTTTFTVTAGEGYFCDTSSGGFTANLPAGTAGASFAVADYTNTFQTGNLTISPNGTNKIGGVNANVVLSTEGQSAYFVYVDDTEGWKNVIDSTSNLVGNNNIIATGGTETTSGNCKIHTFTGPGTFTVTSAAACAADNVVSYLVVAGGGGGGESSYGGGGGAGGYREVVSPSSPYTGSPLNGYPNSPNRITVSAQAYPIAVGGGGAAGSTSDGVNGVNSTFSTITSAGGGYGGGGPFPVGCGHPGGPGGSAGGGSGIGPAGGSTTGGTGNTPPTSPAQGTNGGNVPQGSAVASGGGGGASEAGQNTPANDTAGRGGAGTPSQITGSAVSYAGGGGGTSGPGAGGAASPCGTGGAKQSAGTTNRGGGGGSERAGGSGIVIIRYKFQ
jgi:hypothetical protein